MPSSEAVTRLLHEAFRNHTSGFAEEPDLLRLRLVAPDARAVGVAVRAVLGLLFGRLLGRAHIVLLGLVRAGVLRGSGRDEERRSEQSHTKKSLHTLPPLQTKMSGLGRGSLAESASDLNPR